MGDAERPRVNERLCAYAESGEWPTNGEIVIEQPSNVPGCLADEAVSSNATPVVYCELECAESCEHVVSLLPVSNDIVTSHTIHSTLFYCLKEFGLVFLKINFPPAMLGSSLGSCNLLKEYAKFFRHHSLFSLHSFFSYVELAKIALYPAVDLPPLLRNLQPAPKPICEGVVSTGSTSAT